MEAYAERRNPMVHPKVKDKRSEKIIFLSHCCLNQNAKVRGIAKYPGAIRPLIELLLDRGVGIYQMPCPEMTYLGNMRWGQVKDQYNNPMFRRHCKRLAETIVDQVDNYRQCGYSVLGFVMIDGSPVCGLNRTPRPKKRDQMWGGMAWYVPESEYVREKGNFCEVLTEELKIRGHDDIPFVASPEFDEVGSMQEALKQLKALVE
jgi:predicted secreted protein